MLCAMWTALLFALVPVATHPPTDLVAAATASGRPSECMPAPAKSKRTVWDRARSPRVERYCNSLSRAHARLRIDPEAAELAAHQADEILPGKAAPKVVLARLSLASGDHEAALRLFEAALAIDSRSVEQPLAMHDLARAQRRSGKLEEALATYRVLAPRASLLPNREARARVLLEAAHVALASDDARAVEEALAYLREASRDPHHALRLDVALSLALALHRAGHGVQAEAIVAELRGLRSFAESMKGDYAVGRGDLSLLRGLALESVPTEAAAHYRAAIAAGSGPNLEVARARLAAVERGRPR